MGLMLLVLRVWFYFDAWLFNRRSLTLLV